MWMSDSEFRACENTIAPFVLCIDAFVLRRRVRLTKYYHDAPVWAFEFRNSKGGIGTIAIAISPGFSLTIRSVWSLSDYDLRRRSVKASSQAPLLLPVTDEELGSALDSALDELICWEVGQLTAATGMESEWRQVSRADFYAAQERLPEPT